MNALDGAVVLVRPSMRGEVSCSTQVKPVIPSAATAVRGKSAHCVV